jgi:hypothetical protein
VPSPIASRPRLIVGIGAVMATVVVAAIPLLDPGPLDALVQAVAALAVGAAVVGVVGGFPAWGSVTALVLGAELVATLHDRPAILDARAPVMAAGLLLVAEIVTWAAELREAGTTVAGAPVPRAVVLLAAVVGAYVAALALAGAVSLPVGRDLSLTALGAASVALVTVVLVGLARARTRPAG